jgi:hypothetical protein
MKHAVSVPATEGLLQPFSFGIGYQDFIPVTTPAAGANAVFTVESRNWIRVLGARATVTTSATVANRFVSLDFINARTQTYIRNAAGVIVLASTTNQVFEWNMARTRAEWAANTPVLAPLLPVFLPPGTTVQITLDSIQAADAITAVSLTVERFDTGPIGYEVGFVPDGEPQTD